MSFMSLHGPFMKPGTRQNFRLVISDTAAVYSAEQFALDPDLPVQGLDVVNREEIVIPKGTLVAIKPMPRSYRGRPVVTIANGGVSTNNVFGMPYGANGQIMRDPNVTIGIAHTNITRRADYQVDDRAFGLLLKDAYIEVPYIEIINDSNGQLYEGAALKSDPNGQFVLYRAEAEETPATFETSFGSTMVSANVAAGFEQIKGQLQGIVWPESHMEEWAMPAPAAGIIDWTQPLLPYHDLKYHTIANPIGAKYNVGHANRVGAAVAAVAMGENNAAKAGSYLLTVVSATSIKVYDIALGEEKVVTVVAGETTEDLIPGVKVTLGGTLTAGNKSTVDILLKDTVHGLKGLYDMVAERAELVGAARDKFRSFGMLRILLK